MPPERTINHRPLRRLLLGLCLLAALPAQAAWYQVEVIVFERLRPDPDGERWSENPGLPDRSTGIKLLTEAPPAAGIGAAPAPGVERPRLVPYLQLEPARHRLEGIYRVLRLSSEYRPLLHVAWQQPGEGPDAGRPVHLEVMAPGADGASGTEAALLPALQPLLDGMVGLRVTRFLHVEVDMAFFPPPQVLQAQAPAPAGPGPAGALHADYVRMHDRRKVLLNELHYFDHPLFGVIIQVSRIQLEKEESP